MNASRHFDRHSLNPAADAGFPGAAVAIQTVAVADRARLSHRPRDIGIGYGSSSGYGCSRRYATLDNQRLFRCG